MKNSQIAQHVAPVVCIGMSAGGIEPLQTLFRALKPDTGMEFVVIHHLRKGHPTLLPSILRHCTSMPVQLAAADTQLEPNHVYVIPSGQEIALTDGSFAVRPRSKVGGWTNVVSVFLESLAQSSHPGIAVILSGMDHNGAEALKAFQRSGGITIAQSPDTADSPGMPCAAIKTGVVDYILSPQAIPEQLEKIAANMNLRPVASKDANLIA